MRPAAREHLVTPLDLALLRAVRSEGNLVMACRSLGIRRDRGNYRLRRLSELSGGPVVRTSRGGPTPGGTRLTPLGEGLLMRGTGPLGRQPPRLRRLRPVEHEGTWHRSPEPHVTLREGLTWVVGFSAREGETVRVSVDPESILVSQRRFPTSARNVLEGKVARIDPVPGWQRWVRVLVAGVEIPVALTPSSVKRLRLRPGSRAVLYLKATSVRRV